MQAAGTLRAPTDSEQTATQKAGPSGLRVQRANIDKPAEEDSSVQQFRTVKIELIVGARRKPKKGRAGWS
jgi:hypothetical protein